MDSAIICQNSFESINRNCVEDEIMSEGKSGANEENAELDAQIAINKNDDEIMRNSSDICTQEEAVDVFLAGENKTEFNNDLLSNTENEIEDGISFKSENTFLETNNEEVNVKNKVENCGSKKTTRTQNRNIRNNFISNSLKKRSIKCLNKMQIMEEVKEGGNVEPSSPGHADQRSCEEQVKTEANDEEFEVQNNEENAEVIKVENIEAKDTNNETEATKPDPDANSMNDENYSNSSSPKPEQLNKRKLDHEEIPIKRLKSEIHQNFNSRDKILNEFMDMADCNNMEQIHSFSEQLLAEIKTLNELAKEKEREWNNIIHLKKLKEELLLRMQRKRQVLMVNEKSDYSELMGDQQNGSMEDRLKKVSQSILKYNSANSTSLLTNGSGQKYRNIQPKPSQLCEMNGSSSSQQSKRLTLDVQSIIADYRQRHPESVPRRGRRIRSNADIMNKNPNSILNFSSMTLGSGSQMRQGTDINGELGLLLNMVNSNKHEVGKIQNPDSTISNQQENVSFKDMLLQFAKLSQSERNELIQSAIKSPTSSNVKPPPPYPEVTVHPVRDTVPTTSASSSLLHGILTKTPTKQNNKTSFSPTLARLLTAPEKAAGNLVTSTPSMSNSSIHSSNMSISEILSTSKAHNEITITPVDSFETSPIKPRNGVDEETEDSADRLVIDENSDVMDARKSSSNDTNSDAGDEVPFCQGCNQKAAQFVCAGCGNQWYCSRECQVTAWDEHSEVCSG